MIILKAIGSFFVKLWRWIVETAWVQPLLIVGAIFAVIFSIPSITSWVQSWGLSSSGAFFTSKKQSLEGETNDDSVTTEADKLTDSIYANTELAYAGTKDGVDKAAYGEKFFVVYTESDNATCNNVESAFKYLSDEWNNIYVPSSVNDSLKIYTIFKDESSSNDGDYTNTDNDTKAFYRYLDYYCDFFNTTAQHLEDAPYKINKGLDDTNYKYYEQPDFKNFPTPTILLVDYSDAAYAENRAGVSEALFSVSGETSKTRADLLFQMWNHMDAADTSNPFSKAYKK